MFNSTTDQDYIQPGQISLAALHLYPILLYAAFIHSDMTL